MLLRTTTPHFYGQPWHELTLCRPMLVNTGYIWTCRCRIYSHRDDCTDLTQLRFHRCQFLMYRFQHLWSVKKKKSKKKKQLKLTHWSEKVVMVAALLSMAAAGCVFRLTHRGRDKMDAIWQTTLSNTFSWMKMLEFRLITFLYWFR